MLRALGLPSSEGEPDRRYQRIVEGSLYAAVPLMTALEDFCGVDARGEGIHLILGAVNQPPVHDRFHLTNASDVLDEVGDPELAARVEHVDRGAEEAAGGGIREVIVQPYSREELPGCDGEMLVKTG